MDTLQRIQEIMYIFIVLNFILEKKSAALGTYFQRQFLVMIYFIEVQIGLMNSMVKV